MKSSTSIIREISLVAGWLEATLEGNKGEKWKTNEETNRVTQGKC